MNRILITMILAVTTTPMMLGQTTDNKPFIGSNVEQKQFQGDPVQKGGGVYGDFKPFNALKSTSTKGLVTSEFASAEAYLMDRGLHLNTSDGYRSVNLASNIETFVFPISGPPNTLLSPITIDDSLANAASLSEERRNALDIAQYNVKYSSESMVESARWMIYAYQPELPMVYYVEKLKFSKDAAPVLVVTFPTDGKLVLNYQEGIAYTTAPNASNFNIGAFWQCIRQAFGLPASLNLLDLFVSVCNFPCELKSIRIAARSCVDCATIIGCVDCILNWAEILSCASAEIVQCYNGQSANNNQGICANPYNITSGQPFSGNTSGGQSTFNSYSCPSWNESGPERVHRITLNSPGTMTVSLSNHPGGDLDVFVLSACNPNSCIAAFDDSGTVQATLVAGTYYIVVDGYNGAVSSYTLAVNVTGSGTSQTPQINGVILNSPPYACQPFNAFITGSGFNPANVRVVVTGPGCQTFGSCVVPNDVLGGKTGTSIGTVPLTLNQAGSFQLFVQNGATGAPSSGHTLTVAPGDCGTPAQTFSGSVTTGQNWVQNINVPSGKSRLKVTLSWSGGGDLDLHLNSPTGVHHGYQGVTTGYSGYTSNPEVFDLTNPASGNWQIRVHGYNVSGTKSFTANVQIQ